MCVCICACARTCVFVFVALTCVWRFALAKVARVLPPHWDVSPDAFYLRSTDIERTFLSAESLFAGIYANVTAPSSTADIDVVTINSVELDIDHMYPNPVVCPAQATLESLAKQSAPFQAFVAQVAAPVLRKLSQQLGTNVTFDNYENLLDCSR